MFFSQFNPRIIFIRITINKISTSFHHLANGEYNFYPSPLYKIIKKKEKEYHERDCKSERNDWMSSRVSKSSIEGAARRYIG